MGAEMKYVMEIFDEGSYKELEDEMLKKVLPELLWSVTENEGIEEQSKKRLIFLTKVITDYMYKTTTIHDQED